MSNENIIRAWKDDDFRAGLSEAQRKLLPANPAGTSNFRTLTCAASSGERSQGALPRNGRMQDVPRVGCERARADTLPENLGGPNSRTRHRATR